LESDWAWGVVKIGFNVADCHKVARILTATIPFYVTDIHPRSFAFARTVTPPNAVFPPPWGDLYQEGNLVKPNGPGSPFPYGFDVNPDRPP